MQPVAMQPIAMPGFTAEQTASLQAFISARIAADLQPLLDEMKASLNEALDKHFGPLQPQQQSTPPAPQEAQKEEEKEKRQPLHQATVEDIAESIAEKQQQHGSTVPNNKSMLSTIPRLRAMPACRDPAACPSNLLDSFFGSLPTSFFTLGLLLGYIRCMKGMEATGQG